MYLAEQRSSIGFQRPEISVAFGAARADVGEAGKSLFRAELRFTECVDQGEFDDVLAKALDESVVEASRLRIVLDRQIAVHTADGSGDIGG